MFIVASSFLSSLGLGYSTLSLTARDDVCSKRASCTHYSTIRTALTYLTFPVNYCCICLFDSFTCFLLAFSSTVFCAPLCSPFVRLLD